MKKLLAMLILFLITSPALGKTQCQTGPKAGANHYRLIDGKQCWYKGKNLAKAKLTWGKADARVGTSSTGKPNAVAGPSLRTPVDKAPIVAPPEWTTVTIELVVTSALDQEATEYAISALCGEITWGVCDARLVRPTQQQR